MGILGLDTVALEAALSEANAKSKSHVRSLEEKLCKCMNQTRNGVWDKLRSASPGHCSLEDVRLESAVAACSEKAQRGCFVFLRWCLLS